MDTKVKPNIENLRINGQRLWDSLMELAQIGATPKGGVCRLTLTDLDKQGRDLVTRWAREAGMTVTIDKIGNGFMRRPGRNNSLPPIMTGSHIDTQPTGGKFDGNYGVLAGIEVQAHCKGQRLAAQNNTQGLFGVVGAAHKQCFKGLPHAIAGLGTINTDRLCSLPRTAQNWQHFLFKYFSAYIARVFMFHFVLIFPKDSLMNHISYFM